MNRFGLGERNTPEPHEHHTPLLTLAYLHYWDKGQRVPADIAARLIEDGHDVEALEHQLAGVNINQIRNYLSGSCYIYKYSKDKCFKRPLITSPGMGTQHSKQPRFAVAPAHAWSRRV